MANYRIQVEHARYWRGQPHRWSTVYHMNLAATRAPIDASACDAFAAAEKPVIYPGAQQQNGISSVSIYGPAGGLPIASKVYFDWKTPASWVNTGVGSAWASTTAALEAAEVCAVAQWPTGLSKTGKPIYLRKWYHGAPSSVSGSAQDIAVAQQAQLVTALNALTASLSSTYGLIYASPTGAIPGTPTVRPFYGNHQMPRGRKLKLLDVNGKPYRGRAINPAPVIEAD